MQYPYKLSDSVPSQGYGGTASAAPVIEKRVKNFLCAPVEWLVRAGPFDRLSCFSIWLAQGIAAIPAKSSLLFI